MISPNISLLLFILSVQTDQKLIGRVTDRSWIYRKSVECTYNFKQKYPDKNDPNTTVGFFNSSSIYYCPVEEVPVDISYTVQYIEQYGGDFLNSVYVEFPPPKRECMFGVALLMNPLIQDEEECYKYQFDVYDDSKIHSIERSICVFKYDNPFVENKSVDNSTDLYEDKIGVWFRHIFSGCYAVRFNINAKQRYVASNPKFFKTTYQRTEATVPQVICRYNTRPNLEEKYNDKIFLL